MAGSRHDTVIVVTRKTELDELVERFATAPQARFYLDHAGQDFGRIEEAHEVYQAVVSGVRRAIPRGLKCQTLDRALLPQFSFGEDDLVVVVGQDGLVSNTAKYLSGQPILGVNANPALYDGVLLPFSANNFEVALEAALTGRVRISEVTLAQATLADGQSLLAFNDFFIGAATHVSARYKIHANGNEETQSSSGIVVSTGAGSTGWLQSIYRGAAGVVESLGGAAMLPPNGGRLGWNEECLVFAVREPFPSNATGSSIVHGTITRDAPLRLQSHMGSNGVIFSDGVESDFLRFNHGATATIGLAPNKARLIVSSNS